MKCSSPRDVEYLKLGIKVLEMSYSNPFPTMGRISIQDIYEAPELKPIFDDFLAELPTDMLGIIKQFAEHLLVGITGIKGKLELSIVIDANAVISQAISYIQHGRLPIIIELSKTPFVKLYAPPSIREETLEDERKIEKISRKISKRLGIPIESTKQHLRNAIEEILKHVTLQVPEGYEEYRKAVELVGKRDPKDIDYIWLYFSINAHAIISSDTDITETTVTTWKNMGPLKRIDAVLRKGSLSFVVFSLSGSAILEFLFKTILAIISTLLGMLKAMWDGVKSIIAWISEGIQNLSGTQAFILFMTLGAILYRFGGEIKEWIQNLVHSVIEFLKSIKDFVVGLLEVIVNNPITRALKSLMEYSVLLMELYKEINLRDLEENITKVCGYLL